MRLTAFVAITLVWLWSAAVQSAPVQSKQQLSEQAVPEQLQSEAKLQQSPERFKYAKVSGVSGNLSSIGSDTLANMMTRWGEGFRYLYPNVNPQVQAAGSSTAPPALIAGTSQLGPMSRAMKPSEVDAFVRRYGYPPTAIRVAIDALAMFVHKDNPIDGISKVQIDGLFSANQRCGGQPISHWRQLGLGSDWQQRDVQLFGRNSVSGTYGFFKQRALCNGDFQLGVNEQPGSASVVQSVSTSINAIGYSGIGYQTAGVKMIPVENAEGELINATVENVTSGRYPLSRYLYVYVNKHPNKPLPPLTAEFLSFVLSEQGQQTVSLEGYIPLPQPLLQLERNKLGL